MSQITIASQDIADYYGTDTPATARLVANQEFLTSEGIIISPGAGLWQEFAVSVVSNKIRIASGSAYSTTDSDTPWATYTLSIYSDKGKLLLSLPVAIRIPNTPSSTTWAAILAYSQAIQQPFRSAYYTTDQINILLAALISDTAFDSSWDGVTAVAPSKNAVYDAITSLWSVVNKSGDESKVSNVVLGNDSELQFPINSPGTNYVFELGVWYSTPGAADFQFTLTFPSANIFYRGEKVAPDGTVTQLTGNGPSTFPTTTIVAAADGGGMIFIRGLLQNVSAGNVHFQWAQNTSDPSQTTVLGGSYFKFRSM